MADKSTSNKEHPLAGVVLCFTSILPEQRTDMATVASQMGATHKFDLTSDVTHLLVGEINTPKYKFVARERTDVTVLKPEWVQAVRQSWMEGEDTDICALEEQYKLPAFSGLSICITGFEDMAFRNYIQATVDANGAEFKKDLTKNVSHLIARTAEGQKYKFATHWNIKVVSVKWFTDSIERGMALEEALYHPLLPEEQQGAGAWNRKLPPVKEKSQSSEKSSNPRPRKLRRIASAKLGDQNEGIWGDIVGTGFDNSAPKEPQANGQRHGVSAIPRVASVIQEVKSFASESSFAEAQGLHHQSSEPVDAREGFLHGCFFFVHGFSNKQKNVLRHHLLFNGARLVDSLGEFSRPDIPKKGNGLYIIVSHRTRRTEIPSTDDLAFECEAVTDMWLERCLDAKTLVPPEANVASTPVSKFPIPEFNGMRICSTGFSGIDLLHLSKLVDLMGASYNEYLTPSASVLICNDPQSVNAEKLRHTNEWGVPTVSAEWFWISIQAAQKKPLEPYLVRKPLSRSSSKGPEKQPGSRPEQERQSQHLPHDGNTQPPPTEHAIDAVTKTSRSPQRNNTNHKPIPDESFAKERLQAPTKRTTTIPESRSPSPLKQNPEPNTTSPPKQGPVQSAFNQAVSGLLKQARAAKSRTASSEATEKPREASDTDARVPRRRKPLTGKKTTRTGLSRTSSIDTLNEDGIGSAIESAGPSRTNSRSGPQSFNSIINDGRFDLEAVADDQHLYRGTGVEDEENQTPAMTQLDYEDSDAVAMREQFLSYAGKLVNKKGGTASEGGGGGVVVGEIRELEDVGWGTGRRTRNAAGREG